MGLPSVCLVLLKAGKRIRWEIGLVYIWMKDERGRESALRFDQREDVLATLGLARGAAGSRTK